MHAQQASSAVARPTTKGDQAARSSGKNPLCKPAFAAHGLILPRAAVLRALFARRRPPNRNSVREATT
eukprot:365989-Prymnesium_polylepis.2